MQPDGPRSRPWQIDRLKTPSPDDRSPHAMAAANHTSPDPAPSPTADAPIPPPHGATWLRLMLGGSMMGLANLVPGISGGTMLVAAGV
jgi:hypothetical protein